MKNDGVPPWWQQHNMHSCLHVNHGPDLSQYAFFILFSAITLPNTHHYSHPQSSAKQPFMNHLPALYPGINPNTIAWQFIPPVKSTRYSTLNAKAVTSRRTPAQRTAIEA